MDKLNQKRGKERNRRLHCVVKGRVQGVCYRMFACEEAMGLGLTGWVRNVPDGSVEILAEGDPAALEKFLKICMEGPPLARVSKIDHNYSDATGEFKTFEITYRF